MVMLTSFYLISVVFKSRPPANQKTKTGVEPTILPIVMLFTLCLLYCVYSDIKNNTPI